uniref:Reverse transcriptase domain-containing protein n=1 Tax=Tanacetum cinerariifolium TaxID=118510 RepID=A0A699HD57_TANCI|nr:hypothetical protein [Tanacetum cinerariifolium]
MSWFSRCSWCGGPFNGGNFWHCTNVSFRDEPVYDSNPNSYNQTPNFSNPPPHHNYEIDSRSDTGEAFQTEFAKFQQNFKRFMAQLCCLNYGGLFSGGNCLSCSIVGSGNDLDGDDDDDDYDKVSIISTNTNIFKTPSSDAITTSYPIEKLKDSLIMEDEDLNIIPKKESDEFIKSSVEDLVPILSESRDTSRNDSECILPSCDDFSPINVFEEESMTFSNPLFNSNDDFTSSDDESLTDEDVPEDNIKIYSKPLFKFDEEYISSDKNPLFDEGDILYLESLLNDDLVHHDPSIPAMSVASILEGFTDEPPLEENDDLFDLEAKNND